LIITDAKSQEFKGNKKMSYDKERDEAMDR